MTHVKGMKISIGLVANANQVADKDAIAVQTLRQAGAVVYVKTTMPQSGMVSIDTFCKSLNFFFIFSLTQRRLSKPLVIFTGAL